MGWKPKENTPSSTQLYSVVMGLEETIGFVLVGIIMFVGLAGTFLPGIPGAPLILIGALGHKFYFGTESASWFFIAILILLTVLSLALDFFASMFGAKKLGATWRGITGAVVGAIVGIFFNLPGLILGPFIGAFLFEIAGGRQWKESARAGAGAMLGLVLGTLGRVVCSVIMIALFYFGALMNTLRPSSPQPDPVIAWCLEVNQI